MTQPYYLEIDQAELDEQRALLDTLLAVHFVGQPATVDFNDKITVDCLVGLQNILDAIADQRDIAK